MNTRRILDEYMAYWLPYHGILVTIPWHIGYHIMPYWLPYHAILVTISWHIGYHIMAYWLPYHAILVPNPEIFEIVVTSWFFGQNPDPMGMLPGPKNELWDQQMSSGSIYRRKLDEISRRIQWTYSRYQQKNKQKNKKPRKPQKHIIQYFPIYSYIPCLGSTRRNHHSFG